MLIGEMPSQVILSREAAIGAIDRVWAATIVTVEPHYAALGV